MKTQIFAILALCVSASFAAAISDAKALATCSAEQAVGAPCNPLDDCDQCGDCDWYRRCDRIDGKEEWEGHWVQLECAQTAETDGTVLVANKLFWNADPNGAPHGGVCSHFVTLDDATQTKYRRECKTPCEFKEDNCANKYWYRDPNFNAGIWWTDFKQHSCPANTKWDNVATTCTLCEGDDCSRGCSA